MKNSPYYRQTEFMLRILPLVMREEVFALKGGTAINFFWRDLPRLSFDIDLVYLPMQERSLSLTHISNRLASIRASIERILPGVQVQESYSKEYKTITRLFVRGNNAVVKIEPNSVIRGTLYSVVKKSLRAKVEELFEVAMEINTMSIEDLYGGKICAALDRQHPRDLFDVKLLFENEGLTEGIRKAFIVYLISHDRPIEEVINPRLQNISQIYVNEFQGMAVEKVSLEDLLLTRDRLIKTIKESLTNNEKDFLLSFKKREPDWRLFGDENIQKFPAVKWKMHNLNKMSEDKHNAAFLKLEKYLK